MLQKTAIGRHINIINYLLKPLAFTIFNSTAISFVLVNVILNAYKVLVIINYK